MIHEKNLLYFLSQMRQKMFFYLEKKMAEHSINDISPSYGDILFVLDKKGALTVQQLADLTLKDKSTVSSAIARLEKLGYIQKNANKNDKRSAILKITRKAKKYKPIMNEISETMNKRCFSGISEEEKTAFFKVAIKLYGNICEL